MNRFIELTLYNPKTLHGYTEQNEEVLIREESTPSKKLVQIDRIKSVAENSILIDYAFGRLIYWEYEESYSDIKRTLNVEN